MTTIQLVNAVKAYQSLSHQTAAWNWLQQQLSAEQLHEFAELYRSDPPLKPSASQGPVRGNPITVPWFSQLDSDTDQALRMCFSSSCAMLLATLRPGAISGPNADDQYLRRLQQYGDTTDAKAQIRTLSSFGVNAQFRTDCDFTTIEEQIHRGVPVPCGYLHRGPVSAPRGGGHWLCVVGHTPTHLIVHDPFGEADLVSGETLGTTARYCHYSRKNFGRRWMVNGPRTGWAIIA